MARREISPLAQAVNDLKKELGEKPKSRKRTVAQDISSLDREGNPLLSLLKEQGVLQKDLDD